MARFIPESRIFTFLFIGVPNVEVMVVPVTLVLNFMLQRAEWRRGIEESIEPNEITHARIKSVFGTDGRDELFNERAQKSRHEIPWVNGGDMRDRMTSRTEGG